MAESIEGLHRRLAEAVVAMDEILSAALARQVVDGCHDAYQAIEQGLACGMERAGQLFEEEEYFIPELLMCSDAMYAGIEVLTPHIPVKDGLGKHRVVIGVVAGDTHDIGKNLVKIMLEASGFEVFDLGRDVPAQLFVNRAIELKAEIIALSTLMTTTMDVMEEVVRLVKVAEPAGTMKVMVGGGPVSQAFAQRIGADGYAANASEAVRVARRLVNDRSSRTSSEWTLSRIPVHAGVR